MSISKLIPKCNKSAMMVVVVVVEWRTKENLSLNESGFNFQHQDALLAY